MDVRDFLFERMNVDEREKDNCAGDLRGVEAADEAFEGDDRRVFRAVSAGNQRECRPWVAAADDYDRNLCGGIGAGGDVKRAGGVFAGLGGGRGPRRRRAVLRGGGTPEERGEGWRL